MDVDGSLIDRLWGVRSGPDTGTAQVAVLSGRDGSQVLLPLRNNAVAAAPLIRHVGSMSPGQRLLRRAAWLGMRTGLARPWLHHRALVPAIGDEVDGPSLHEILADLLGAPAVDLSVSFGPPRPNQKPVIRVMTTKGVSIGFAKIGWDGLTARLVETEAGFLGSPAARKLTLVGAPELVHLGWWKSNRIAVFTPLLGRAGRREVHAETFADVAGVDGISNGKLGDSSYRQGLQESIAALSQDAKRQPDHWHRIIVERWGSLDLSFGRWHGDWTPWNMARGEGRKLILWDWERTRGDVPVGFDVFNFHMQPLIVGRAGAASEIETQVREKTRPVLREMGLDEVQHEAVLCLYLLEMCVRHGDAGHPAAIAPVRSILGQLLGNVSP